MAWVENETWDAEQGIDALKIFELIANATTNEPWQFTGYDVNATVYDDKGRVKYPVTVVANATLGTVRLILPEAIVNTLKVGGSYRYDCLMIPPGSALADDNFLATGSFTVALRASRRDT
jgi:hypothetical protein